MIYGNVRNPMLEQQTRLLPKILREALNFLKNENLASHPAGRFDMALAGIPVILQVLDLTTAPRGNLRPEIHRKSVDVQFLAAGGPEAAGFYTDQGDNTVDEDLLETPRDILFYNNNPSAPEGRIIMTPGTYAMYFPWDVHIPAIQTSPHPVPIRKIVIKVPLEACMEE